jgi:hypothetical protein
LSSLEVSEVSMTEDDEKKKETTTKEEEEDEDHERRWTRMLLIVAEIAKTKDTQSRDHLFPTRT